MIVEFTGHIPSDVLPVENGAGMDVLLTLHGDGTMTVATRPGRDQRWIRWSAPTELAAEPLVIDEVPC